MRKVTFDENNDKELKVICQTCKIGTQHLVLRSLKEEGSVPMTHHPQDDFYWCTYFEIIKCLGCQTISFRSEEINSEDRDEDGYMKRESLYPRRDEDTLQMKDFYSAPRNLRRIYRETIECFNADLLILCSAGTRALVEGVCKANGIKSGTVYWDENGIIKNEVSKSLGGKINGLYEKGILSKNNSDALHEHKFLGNKAVHELHSPLKEDLRIAIEIIEIILESIYEVPKKTRKLRDKR